MIENKIWRQKYLALMAACAFTLWFPLNETVNLSEPLSPHLKQHDNTSVSFGPSI